QQDRQGQLPCAFEQDVIGADRAEGKCTKLLQIVGVRDPVPYVNGSREFPGEPLESQIARERQGRTEKSKQQGDQREFFHACMCVSFTGLACRWYLAPRPSDLIPHPSRAA